MIGFDLVGWVRWDGMLVFDHQVADDDILGFSHALDGPLRSEMHRACECRGLGVRGAPGLVACGDYVFVARALGEHAFRPCTVPPAP